MILKKGQKVRITNRAHSHYNKIGYISHRAGNHYYVIFSDDGNFSIQPIYCQDLVPECLKHNFHSGMLVVSTDHYSPLYQKQGTLVSLIGENALVDFGDRPLDIFGQKSVFHHCIALEDLEPVASPQPGNRKGLRQK